MQDNYLFQQIRNRSRNQILWVGAHHTHMEMKDVTEDELTRGIFLTASFIVWQSSSTLFARERKEDEYVLTLYTRDGKRSQAQLKEKQARLLMETIHLRCPFAFQKGPSYWQWIVKKQQMIDDVDKKRMMLPKITKLPPL